MTQHGEMKSGSCARRPGLRNKRPKSRLGALGSTALTQSSPTPVHPSTRPPLPQLPAVLIGSSEEKAAVTRQRQPGSDRAVGEIWREIVGKTWGKSGRRQQGLIALNVIKVFASAKSALNPAQLAPSKLTTRSRQ